MIFTGTPAASGNLHASSFAPDEQAVSRVATAMLTGYLASAHVLGRGRPEADSAAQLEARSIVVSRSQSQSRFCGSARSSLKSSVSRETR